MKIEIEIEFKEGYKPDISYFIDSISDICPPDNPYYRVKSLKIDGEDVDNEQ